MKKYQNLQLIGQLEKRKGGYSYLKIEAEIVNKFKNKRDTRLLCTLDKSLTFQCGLNHLGDGNFFIIISTKTLKTIGKKPGDSIHFELTEDPNPLGIEIPKILEALLEQDEELKTLFNKMTDGKKRSVIHAISKIKDIDKQIQKSIYVIKNGINTRLKKQY